MYKEYCIVAKESLDKMNGIRGKMMGNSGHAFTHAYWDAEDRFPEDAKAYRASKHAYKIVLVVDTVAELHTLHAAYKDVCGVSLVTDAGFTVFNEPTTTMLGIGPIHVDKIGEDISSLKLLR